MAVKGVLLIPNMDYGKTVSAVDITLNGSQIEVCYLDNGQLKAGSISCVYSWSDALSGFVANPAMSGCSII
jgi:hypothetical protein